VKDNKRPLVTILSCTFAAAAYLIADSAMAGELPKPTPTQERNVEWGCKADWAVYQALMTLPMPK